MAKNRAKLTAGMLSSKIIAKLCQCDATEEKSENIKEKKLTNPDWLKSYNIILSDGTKLNNDDAKVIEKIIILRKTKKRSSL